MLIEFSVGNYLSFKETVTFSMVASQEPENEYLDENNVFQVSDELSLLKSAAVYGANASGKSNLAKAINFMKWFVLNSSKETQFAEKIDVEIFRLSTETEGQPSFFEIVFILDNIIYRYGFEVTTDRIISEWLYRTIESEELSLYERDLDKITFKPLFEEAEGLEKLTRNNSLFLSVVAQFNGEISKQILSWFINKLTATSGLLTNHISAYTVAQLSHKEYGDEIVQFIKKLDLDISDIKSEDIPITSVPLTKELLYSLNQQLIHAPAGSRVLSMETIMAFHRKYNTKGELISLEKFEFDKYESEGTKKIFAFAGPLLDTLRNGRIIVIDELDTSLHPLITHEIVSLFNSNETNPKNAQLIFMTHDTNLLSNNIFRKDQIWFTEKNRQQATDLYSLVEYKIDASKTNYETDYIRGRYGGIPFIGGLSRLFSKHDS